MRRKQTSLGTWLAYCQEYDGTDLNQKEFCRQKGISYSRFNHYFVREYQKQLPEPSEKKTGFIEVMPERFYTNRSREASHPEIRVSFPNGMVIHFPKELAIEEFIAFTKEVAGV